MTAAGPAHDRPTSVAAAVRHVNYLRAPRQLGIHRHSHKEWFHFSVTDGEVDCIVNFSLFDQATGLADGNDRLGRVICLVGDGDWTGDMMEFGPTQIATRSLGHQIALGPNFMRFERGHYEVAARCERLGIEVDLVLEPATMPAQANNTRLPPDGFIHWVFVPRLVARGTIRTARRLYVIEDGVAYHDHNWGRFSWGDDFAWEWGYGLGASGDGLSVVSVQLSNRNHTVDLARSLFVYRGNEQVRLFRDDCITTIRRGLLRPERPLRVPGVMRLLLPGCASDIPAEVIIHAQDGPDHLTCRYLSRSVVQIGVPHDRGLGVTTINEVRGTIDLEGVLGGQPLRASGPSFFEFLDG